MLNRIKATIEEYELFILADRILVAVSGGPDSVFLAHSLHEMGYEIGIAHVNYQLRGEESEKEEILVRNLAEDLGIPSHIVRYPTQKLVEESKESLQMVARRLRYDFFDSLLKKEKYEYCATAHHRDDQVETILMSMIKGNSPSWLLGIPPQRKGYVRPLLRISKQEIIEDLEKRSIPYSVDSSNLKSDYLRNKIRNQVIPLLEEINPSVSENISERFGWFTYQQDVIQSKLGRWFWEYSSSSERYKHLNLKGFEEEHGNEWSRLLVAFGFENWGLHGNQIWEALRLINSPVGKEVEGKWGKITRDREGFTWQPTTEGIVSPVIINSIEADIRVEFNGRQLHLGLVDRNSFDPTLTNTYFLDPEKVVFPITIREWEAGDKMIPYGMSGFKKLSDIFTDEKFSPVQKDKAIVIEDEGMIICLSEFRISNLVWVDEYTEPILKIEIN